MCEHPFIDKSMVITEPTVPSAWLLGLDSKLYPSNKQHMFNKDLTLLMHVRQNRAIERGCASRVDGVVPLLVDRVQVSLHF